MDNKILLLDVNLKERIWGGDYLNNLYQKNITSKVGEAWILSGHTNGPSKVLNDNFKDTYLNDLYKNNKPLFGKSNFDRFPLLIKLLDAKDDLSVQVHPDDDYALKHHNDLGKNECWYIVEANDDSTIIYGHNAKNKEDFKKFIDNQKWSELLIKTPVKKGDFFNIPTGTVHAIGKGIKILEIQQSSDTTYRLYDYNRKDDNGNLRNLHINEALDVINYSDKKIEFIPISYGPVTRLLSNKYFTLDKIDTEKELLVSQENDYSILVTLDKHLEIIIDEKTYTIDPYHACLITSLTNNFKIKPSGTVFLVRENDFDLKETYQYNDERK